ncbi:hypothetical protein HON22_05155, partial [Candidatus Peregrinibacteria bacterium]|nr:hypothetical protein [Candidatus Peregrinibacteria bacterium]
MHINKRLLLVAGIAFFIAIVFGPRIEKGSEAAILYQANSFLNSSDVGCSQNSDTINCKEVPFSISGACETLKDTHLIKLKEDYFSGQCQLTFARSSFPSNWSPGENCRESASDVICDTSLYKELSFQGIQEKLSLRFVTAKDDLQYENIKISEIQSVWNTPSGFIIFSLGDTQYFYDESYFVKNAGSQIVKSSIPQFSSCKSLEEEDIKSSPVCLEDNEGILSSKNGVYY